MDDLPGILIAGGIPATDDTLAELENALETARRWLYFGGKAAQFRKSRNEVIAFLGEVHFHLTGTRKIGRNGPQYRFICGCMKVLQLEIVSSEYARNIVKRKARYPIEDH